MTSLNDLAYQQRADQALHASANHLRVYEDINQAQQAIADAKNNAGRPGRSLHQVVTIGAGELRLAGPITFQLTFVGAPHFTTGVRLATGNLVSGAFPLTTAGVWRWQTDDRGYFVGAYLWFSVGAAPTAVSSQLQEAAAAQAQAQAMSGLILEHHLAFEGTAIRDVDYDAITQDG